MIWGIAVLIKAHHLIILLGIHLVIAHLFDRYYVRPIINVSWVRCFVWIGVFTLSLILAAIWTYYIGNGVFKDVELFEYYQY